MIAALDDLARRGVRSCAGSDRDAMHAMSFDVAPVKEVSVVGPQGETRCTNLALPFAERLVISASIRSARPDTVIEVVRLGERVSNAVRVRRAIAEDDRGHRIGAARAARREPRRPGDDRDRRHRLERCADPADGVRPWRRRDNPVGALARAIRDGEIVPYYQPIVDLTTARVVSAEVLVRWRKPDGLLVPPVQFIALAESSGLIVDLTRALMRRVCAETGTAMGARPDFRVGFNLSARHFLDEQIVEDVRAIFAPSPIALGQVLLEVTERQALENLDIARHVIAALQGLGVRVGIDDLGTGHSGLSYILKPGVDFIKIDKIFVDAIDTERYSVTIIETLVGLARDMRMEIIAEGVETFEQVHHLRARGIRRAQGYVFAPPLPGPSFLQLLEAAHAADSEEAAMPAAAAPVAALVA